MNNRFSGLNYFNLLSTNFFPAAHVYFLWRKKFQRKLPQAAKGDHGKPSGSKPLPAELGFPHPTFAFGRSAACPLLLP